MDCLRQVSKVLSGAIKSQLKRDDGCRNPDCRTLFRLYDIDASAKAGASDCDNAPPLDGHLHGRIRIYTRDNMLRRGYHEGRIEWGSQLGTLQCSMRGTINCGTHHDPLPDCEPCSAKNHMEGVMHGMFVKGEKAKFCASYAIDLQFEPESSDAEIRGVVEGVLIIPCEISA